MNSEKWEKIFRYVCVIAQFLKNRPRAIPTQKDLGQMFGRYGQTLELEEVARLLLEEDVVSMDVYEYLVLLLGAIKDGREKEARYLRIVVDACLVRLWIIRKKLCDLWKRQKKRAGYKQEAT